MPQPDQNTTNPDYEILAELRGHAEDEFYKIQVEFVDVHTNEILFNQLYRIRKEASDEPPPEQPTDQQPSAPTGDQSAPPDNNAAPPPPPAAGGTAPL